MIETAGRDRSAEDVGDSDIVWTAKGRLHQVFDWLGSLPDAWSAMDGVTIATATQAVAVLLATLVAMRQLQLMRQTREQESRAYVVAHLDFRDDSARFLPSLVVSNIGRTQASEITVVSTPAMTSTLYDDGAGPLDFAQRGIPTLAPGQSISTLFDSLIQRRESDHADRYDLEIGYRDVFGERHVDRATIDLTPYWATQYTTVHGLHDVHAQLKKLNQELRHLRSGFGGAMPLTTETRRASVRRSRVERDLARKARGGWRGPYPSSILWMERAVRWLREEALAVARWMAEQRRTR